MAKQPKREQKSMKDEIFPYKTGLTIVNEKESNLETKYQAYMAQPDNDQITYD